MASSLSRFGAKPPSSPTFVLWPAFLSTRLEVVEDLGDHADALGEALGSDGHDHEFLEVDLVVGVLAAVDDVGHRHGQDAGVGAADVAVERQPVRERRRPWRRPGETPRIALAPSLPLFGGAVGGDQRAVEADLVAGVAADDDLGQGSVDVRDGLGHALAAGSASCRRREARPLRECPCWPPRGPRPGRACRRPGSRRLRRSGCRGCPGSRAREHGRS